MVLIDSNTLQKLQQQLGIVEEHLSVQGSLLGLRVVNFRGQVLIESKPLTTTEKIYVYIKKVFLLLRTKFHASPLKTFDATRGVKQVLSGQCDLLKQWKKQKGVHEFMSKAHFEQIEKVNTHLLKIKSSAFSPFSSFCDQGLFPFMDWLLGYNHLGSDLEKKMEESLLFVKSSLKEYSDQESSSLCIQKVFRGKQVRGLLSERILERRDAIFQEELGEGIPILLRAVNRVFHLFQPFVKFCVSQNFLDSLLQSLPDTQKEIEQFPTKAKIKKKEVDKAKIDACLREFLTSYILKSLEIQQKSSSLSLSQELKCIFLAFEKSRILSLNVCDTNLYEESLLSSIESCLQVHQGLTSSFPSFEGLEGSLNSLSHEAKSKVYGLFLGFCQKKYLALYPSLNALKSPEEVLFPFLDFLAVLEKSALENSGNLMDLHKFRNLIKQELVNYWLSLPNPPAQESLDALGEKVDFSQGLPFFSAWREIYELNEWEVCSFLEFSQKLQKIHERFLALDLKKLSNNQLAILRLQLSEMILISDKMQTISLVEGGTHHFSLHSSEDCFAAQSVKNLLETIPTIIGESPIEFQVIMDTSGDEAFAQKLQEEESQE